MDHVTFQKSKLIVESMEALTEFSRTIVQNRKKATLEVNIVVDDETIFSLSITDKDEIEKIRRIAAGRCRKYRHEFRKL